MNAHLNTVKSFFVANKRNLAIGAGVVAAVGVAYVAKEVTWLLATDNVVEASTKATKAAAKKA